MYFLIIHISIKPLTSTCFYACSAWVSFNVYIYAHVYFFKVCVAFTFETFNLICSSKPGHKWIFDLIGNFLVNENK